MSSVRLEPYVREKDLGTPQPQSQRKVSVTIDGERIDVPQGSTVLRAAAELGIQIPKLCATESPRALRLLPNLRGPR